MHWLQYPQLPGSRSLPFELNGVDKRPFRRALISPLCLASCPGQSLIKHSVHPQRRFRCGSPQPSLERQRERETADLNSSSPFPRVNASTTSGVSPAHVSLVATTPFPLVVRRSPHLCRHRPRPPSPSSYTLHRLISSSNRVVARPKHPPTKFLFDLNRRRTGTTWSRRAQRLHHPKVPIATSAVYLGPLDIRPNSTDLGGSELPRRHSQALHVFRLPLDRLLSASTFFLPEAEILPSLCLPKRQTLLFSTVY